ncbi:MAG: TlyA family RNA methyltransferase [Oscillospiraceae bacterium]|jgi:23S rRNA (cytidine1920-2'-O)/16S rRNA (cytidine1409-2'-O)-methyltransferase|nr:TlyA family RNA methyltransferase [Oscillospiraceae bacterium]
MPKTRLDILLCEKNLAPSREKAKALIMAGVVYANGQKADKPGESYPQTTAIEVRDTKQKYVSRGGYKLEKALQQFPIDLNGAVAMDIGASTGGFCDCMLQNGAAKVYAVDVGYGQLAWSLRSDSRVVNLERTNMRYLEQEKVAEQIDFFSMDVAFISIKLLLPVVADFLKANAKGVCLIKPQFEAGRENIGKKGVVKDSAVHINVVKDICSFCFANGYSVLGLTFSPIKGPEGNIEYLVFLQKSEKPVMADSVVAEEVVFESHQQLDVK